MNEAIALALGVVVAAVPAPAYIRWLRRRAYRQHVRDDGPASHSVKEGTPTMGGVLILAGGLTAALVGAAARGQVTAPFLLVVLLTAAYGGLGVVDDLLMIRRGRSLGLRARHKLLFQFVLAGLFLWGWQVAALPDANVHNPFGRGMLALGAWYWPLAALFVVGTSNAVNLTDGLDGLASGLAALALVSLGTVALHYQQLGLAIFGYALAGGCLGFLLFNAHPARIFMGDTGSLALGGALAGMALVLGAEVLLLVVGLVFYVEALSVIMQVISYKTTRRRIFRMSPIHHHFELGGWPETAVVARFWVAAAVVAVVALSLVR